MNYTNTLLSPETHERLFNATCKNLGLDEADIGRLPPMSYPDTQKLFDISMLLTYQGVPGAVKKADLFPNQDTSILDMIIAGNIDGVVAMLEAAGGGPIHHPAARLDDTTSVIVGGKLQTCTP